MSLCLVTLGRKTQSITAWAKELGISQQALSYRIAKHGAKAALRGDFKSSDRLTSIIYEGEHFSPKVLAKRAGVSRQTLVTRIKSGMPIEKAVSMPARSGPRGDSRSKKVQCAECGKQLKVPESRFKQSKSGEFYCGEPHFKLHAKRLSNKLFDLTGQQFNQLKVLRRVENDHLGRTAWECACRCGETKIVASPDLKTGSVKSCGCARRRTHLIGGVPFTADEICDSTGQSRRTMHKVFRLVKRAKCAPRRSKELNK